MAIKANASSQGSDFKLYVGVGSFRVLGVNPSKAELEEFFGRTMKKEPEYLKDKQDENNDNAPYKKLLVKFMIQADCPSMVDPINKETKKTNANLVKPYKDTIDFFLDSRYYFNSDGTKVQVVDKYGRFAWVTKEQARNHQIPVYSDGPAKLDKDYRPAYRGEEELTKFILNYLNVTPIDTYNRNTGEWMTNPHPEDCEGKLYRIQDYFKGDISELKEFCQMIPSNTLKLCVGIRTDNEGRQFSTIYNRVTLRNGAKSYLPILKELRGSNTTDIYSDAKDGEITNIHEYVADVKETDLSKKDNDPFAAANELPQNDDLPFGEPVADEDPFKDMK